MSFLSVPVSFQSLFGTKRQIDDIKIDVIISESTNDALTITKQPVQKGATISDHAYKEPITLTMIASFRDDRGNLIAANTTLKQKYEALLKLQSSRTPFTVITPKRTYDNMLISALGVTTDKNTENCLSVSISLQEVIIVNVTTASVPRAKQKNPGVTGKTEPAGRKQSFLRQETDGIKNAFSKAAP